MVFICYPKCTTYQKARKWLDEHKIVYELRDIKTANPACDELAAWHERSGLPLAATRITPCAAARWSVCIVYRDIVPSERRVVSSKSSASIRIIIFSFLGRLSGISSPPATYHWN